ncbi:phosphinothricin N-acetyltransferase [Pelomyxa schiedti]|nr:phosphinothricin N-acetyltransferase [Pelomyxa schiedti]
MTYRIRGATASDGAAVAAIYSHYVENTPVSFEEHPPTASEMATRITRITETHPWLICEMTPSLSASPPNTPTSTSTTSARSPPKTEPGVIEGGGRGSHGEWVVVGYAYGSGHHERAAYRWSCDVSVYVLNGHTGKGIGKHLYATLISILKSQGFCVACAGITMPNEASEALHRHFGFVPVGVYPAIGFKFGQWRDVMYLTRRLDTESSSSIPVCPQHDPIKWPAMLPERHGFLCTF